MPTHGKKKSLTPNTTDSTQGQSAPVLPEQDEFRQHLRELARDAIRVVLEDVMREELDALIGVGWGESSPKRKGYRNGYYIRDLVTTSGRIEDLQVPRDREGQFHTQVFCCLSNLNAFFPPHNFSSNCLRAACGGDKHRASLDESCQITFPRLYCPFSW